VTTTEEKLDRWPVVEPAGTLLSSVESWLCSLAIHGIVLGGVTVLVTMLKTPVSDDLQGFDVALVDGGTLGSAPPEAPAELAGASAIEPVMPARASHPPPVETGKAAPSAPPDLPSRSAGRTEAEPASSKSSPVDEGEPVQPSVPAPLPPMSAESPPVIQETPDPQPWSPFTTEISSTAAPPADLARERQEEVTLAPPSRLQAEVPEADAPSTSSEERPSDRGEAAPSPPQSQNTGPRAEARADANAPHSGRPDYGWLAEALWSRVERMKHYPQLARMNHWEGKVILRAVIREDGELLGLDIARSSGHPILDDEAVASVRQAFPIKLPRSLGKSQVALQIPISYRLDR
jgi:protein TonB